MCSNWALRSGCLEPSSALRLAWREKPSRVSSLRTLLGLTAWPMSPSAAPACRSSWTPTAADARDRRSVAGSTRRSRSASRLASRSVSGRGPPPSRRTRPPRGGGASRSFSPRPIVERASPVICETAASPPRPAARASLAANTRRPRSSRFEPSASHRCSIPPGRSCRNGNAQLPRQGIPQTCLSHSAAASRLPSNSVIVANVLSAGGLARGEGGSWCAPRSAGAPSRPALRRGAA